MSNTNIERVLLDLALSELKPMNIGGVPFQLITIHEDHESDFEEIKTEEEAVSHAANLGLAIKGERAVDYSKMDETKFELFWAKNRFSVPVGEPSYRELFGRAVLRESNMEHLLEKYNDVEGELEELLDYDEDGEEVEIDANGRPIVSAA